MEFNETSLLESGQPPHESLTTLKKDIERLRGRIFEFESVLDDTRVKLLAIIPLTLWR